MMKSPDHNAPRRSDMSNEIFDSDLPIPAAIEQHVTPVAVENGWLHFTINPASVFGTLLCYSINSPTDYVPVRASRIFAFAYPVNWSYGAGMPGTFITSPKGIEEPADKSFYAPGLNKFSVVLASGPVRKMIGSTGNTNAGEADDDVLLNPNHDIVISVNDKFTYKGYGDNVGSLRFHMLVVPPTGNT